MFTRFLLLLFTICLLSLQLTGQTTRKIELLHCNEVRQSLGKHNGLEVPVRTFVGEVALREDSTYFYGDSILHYFEQERLEAYGDVLITNGDTFSLYGNKLIYKGISELAEVTGKVVLWDSTMNLVTDTLFYDLAAQSGAYYSGATLKTKTDTLISKEGKYYSKTNQIHFKQDVQLFHEQFMLFTDSLKFNTKSEIAEFIAPTYIESDSNTIFCSDGWYDTQLDKAMLKGDPLLEHPPQTIEADSIYYDRPTNMGIAYQNVTITDTSSEITVWCNYAQYNELKGTVFATKYAILANAMNEEDTLYITADTLQSFEDSLARRYFIAHKNAKILSNELQGSCDSLYYHEYDSIVEMMQSPVLWNDSTQFNGDTIYIFRNTDYLDSLDIINNGFIGQELDTFVYHQIAGRRITAYFSSDTMTHAWVNGNGEMIYYVQDEQKAFIGAKKGICNKIYVKMKGSGIDYINTLGDPNGSFLPMKVITPSTFLLSGFKWQGDERPASLSEFRQKKAARKSTTSTKKTSATQRGNK